MNLPFDDLRYSADASSNINYFLVADVKCGLCDCEINKNHSANATHGPSPVPKMFRDRTEAMMDRRDPGSVLTPPLPTCFLWSKLIMYTKVVFLFKSYYKSYL